MIVVPEPSLAWRIAIDLSYWLVGCIALIAAYAWFAASAPLEQPHATSGPDDPLWPLASGLPDVRDGVPGVLAEQTRPRFRDPALFRDQFTDVRHARLHAIQGGRR